MKKILKYAIAGITALSLSITLSMSAGAYVLLGTHHKSSTIYYYYDNWIGANASNAVVSAVNAWRAKTTQATLKPATTTSGYTVYISVGNYDTGWDGLTVSNVVGNEVESQTVIFNMTRKAWNDPEALKSVAGHEFGHVFGIGDQHGARVIMNDFTYGDNSRYATYKITTPQTDDVNGVNAIY